MPIVNVKTVDLLVLLFCTMSVITPCESKANIEQANAVQPVNLHPHISTELVQFKAAERALKQRRYQQFESLLAELVDHPLAAYLKRDRLIAQLSDSTNRSTLPNEIKLFLKRHHNQVVSRKLRYYWLNYLADSSQTKLFREFYQPQRSHKLRCYHLMLQITDGQSFDDLSPQIEQIWLTGQSLPKQCDPLFLAWKQKGELTEERIWQRMQLAAKQKKFQLVNYLSRLLPVNSQRSGHWLVKVHKNPSILKQRLPKQLKPAHAQTIILAGLEKLAWSKPKDAIKYWKRYQTLLALSVNQKTQLRRAIGLSLAINGSTEASNWLHSVELQADHSVKQWLLSNRLNHSDWTATQKYTLHNLISEGSDKWLFWNAIATRKLGNLERSNAQLKKLAKRRSYYGFLAAASLDKPLNLNRSAVTVETAEIARISNNAVAQRAKALFELGRYSEARSEWNQLLKSLPKSSYVAAAHLAHHWNWNHQSILAFARSKSLDDIEKRFPLYQHEQYLTSANQFEIPISWAYAITRQESAFKKDATSSAGAQGLMQLKPSTARLVARKKLKHLAIAKLSNHAIARKKLLHQPELNITLGVAHLKQMLEYYEGNHILATAAYNAGSARVDDWLKDNNVSNSIAWIEQIPFKETREYVKNVLTYQEIYAELINEDARFISNINKLVIPTHNRSSSQVSTR